MAGCLQLAGSILATPELPGPVKQLLPRLCASHLLTIKL